jgi:hypothetical protein
MSAHGGVVHGSAVVLLAYAPSNQLLVSLLLVPWTL